MIDDKDIAEILLQFNNAVVVYKNKDFEKAFELCLNSVISDIFMLRLQYLKSKCTQSITITNDCIDNCYIIIQNVIEDPINDDYTLLCVLVYLELYKRCIGQQQCSPKFDYIVNALQSCYILIERTENVYMELFGSILCFICNEIIKYDKFQYELINGIHTIIIDILKFIQSQLLNEEFQKINNEIQNYLQKNNKDKKVSTSISTIHINDMVNDSNDELDWDKEFGITTQISTSTLKNEENILEKCKVIEEINEEQEICINYDIPSIMYGKVNGKKKLQAIDLVNHFDKLLKDVKKFGSNRKSTILSKTTPTKVLKNSNSIINHSKDSMDEYSLLLHEIQYNDDGLKGLEKFLNYLDSLNEDNPTIKTLKVIDEVIVSFGYSPVTYAFIGRTDIEASMELFHKLEELYKENTSTQYKQQILFCIGLYYEEQQDFKSAEGCYFEIIYLLTYTNSTMIITPLGLESLIHYVQILVKLNKRSYINYVLDLIFSLSSVSKQPLRIIQLIASIALQLHFTQQAIKFYRYLLEKFKDKKRTNEMLSTARTLCELFYNLGLFDTAMTYISPHYFTEQEKDILHLPTLPLYRSNCIRYAELVLRNGCDNEIINIETYLGKLYGDESCEIATLKAKAFSKKGQIESMIKSIKTINKSMNKKDEYYIHTINDNFALQMIIIAIKGYLKANAANVALTFIDIILICIQPVQYQIISYVYLLRGKALHQIYMSSTQSYPEDLHDYYTSNDLFMFLFEDMTIQDNIIPLFQNKIEIFNNSIEVLQEMIYSMDVAFDMAEKDSNEYLQNKINICKAEVLNDVLLRWPDNGLIFNQSQRVLYFNGTTFINESLKHKNIKKDEFVIDAKEIQHFIEKVLIKVCDVISIKQMISCYVLLSETSYLQNNKNDAYTYVQLTVQLLYCLIFNGSDELSSTLSPTFIRFLYNIIQRIIRIMLIFGKEIINSNYDIFDTYNMLSNLLHRQMRTYSNNIKDVIYKDNTILQQSEKIISHIISISNKQNVTKEISKRIQSYIHALIDNARLGLIGRFRYDQVKEWNKSIIQNILSIQQQIHGTQHNIPPLGVITKMNDTTSIYTIYTKKKNVQRRQSQTNQLLHRNMTYIFPLYNAIIMYHTIHKLFVFPLTFDTELQPPKAPQYNQMQIKIIINKSYAIYNVNPSISIENFITTIIKEKDKKRSTFTLSSKRPKLIDTSKSFHKELKEILLNNSTSSISNIQLFRNSQNGLIQITQNYQSALYLCFTPNELKHANIDTLSSTPVILYLNKKLQLQNVVKKGIVIDKSVMKNVMISLTKSSTIDNITKLQTDVKEWMNKSFEIINTTILTNQCKPVIICHNYLNILPWEYIDIFNKAIRFTSFKKYNQIHFNLSDDLSQQHPIIVILRNTTANIMNEEYRRDMIHSQLLNDLNCTDEYLKLYPIEYNGLYLLPEAKQLVQQYPKAVILKDIQWNLNNIHQLNFLNDGHQYVILMSVTDLVESSDLLTWITQNTTVGIACISKIRAKKISHLPRHIKQISQSSPQTSVKLKYDYVNFILNSLKGSSCYPSILLNFTSD
ncbi:Clu domain-containing protein [Entamoeba marina]